MDSMGTIDRFYKEEYYTLIRTKYETYGPCGLENILAHLSQRLICELIVYPCSGVRPSVVHNFKDLIL